MMKRKTLLRKIANIGLASAFSLLLVSCGEETTHKALGAKLHVVATTTMIGDMAEAVGGERIELTVLMGPGVDPHLYKPRPSDRAALSKADLIFYNGLLLEGQMAALYDQAKERGKPVHAVVAGIPSDKLIGDGEDNSHPDPHVWGDVELWRSALVEVVDAFVDADAANAAEYRARADAYDAQLVALHAWAKVRMAEVPENKRLLVTSHDAFSYFGRAYGFEVLGIQGISTASQAGVADLANTVDLLKKREINAIFTENSVSPDLINAVKRDAGVKVGGELFSDSTGAKGVMETASGETYDVSTYVGMIKHNVNTIVENLK